MSHTRRRSARTWRTARSRHGAQDRRGLSGSMVECEDNWNCQLENITFTAKDGKVSQLEHVFIRGSRVRFMIIPDMLKNTPMFKRLEARIRGKGSAVGVGRGPAVAMRAQPRNEYDLSCATGVISDGRNKGKAGNNS